MPRKTSECVLAGCTGPAGVPGTARGMCAKHYRAWQKYGDPLEDRTRTRQFCNIGDCGKPCVGRGLCGAHWYHWKTHGDPARQHSRRVDPGDGLRRCSRCRADKALSEFGRGRSTSGGYATYCKACTRAIAAEWRAAHPEYVPPPKDRQRDAENARKWRARNPEYAISYRERTREWMRNYSKEWRRRNPEAQRAHATARRTRRHDAYVEPVSPKAVYERDGWTCGICHEAIDCELSNPDPMSASVDHIIPLARHGKHAMVNVQAAHLICNMRKGTKILAVSGSA